MNLNPVLSTIGSAFVGGAMTYLSVHLAGGFPTNLQAVGTTLLGAALTGVVAVVHLYMPAPSGGSK